MRGDGPDPREPRVVAFGGEPDGKQWWQARGSGVARVAFQQAVVVVLRTEGSIDALFELAGLFDLLPGLNGELLVLSHGLFALGLGVECRGIDRAQEAAEIFGHAFAVAESSQDFVRGDVVS